MASQTLDRNIVLIEKNLCKGCGLCIDACPENVLKLSDNLNDKGFHYAEFIDNGKCTGCAICYYACPELECLTVLKKGYVLENEEVSL